jgi:hypothetical protein
LRQRPGWSWREPRAGPEWADSHTRAILARWFSMTLLECHRHSLHAWGIVTACQRSALNDVVSFASAAGDGMSTRRVDLTIKQSCDAGFGGRKPQTGASQTVCLSEADRIVAAPTRQDRKTGTREVTQMGGMRHSQVRYGSRRLMTCCRPVKLGRQSQGKERSAATRPSA